MEVFCEHVRRIPKLIEKRNKFAHSYYSAQLNWKVASGEKTFKIDLKNPIDGSLAKLGLEELETFISEAADLRKFISENPPGDEEEFKEYLGIRF